MRWRWWRPEERAEDQAGHDAARKAKLSSRQELRDVRAQRSDVDDLIDSAERMIVKNGLAEQALKAMRRRS